MKSGTNGSVGVLKTVAAPHHTVKDTYKQCPGDKFAFACDTKNTFTSFDIRTGVASIKAPRSTVDIAMSCKLTKYSRFNSFIEKTGLNTCRTGSATIS